MLLTKAEAAKLPFLQLKASVEGQPHLNRINSLPNPTVTAFVRYLESSFFKFLIVLFVIQKLKWSNNVNVICNGA